jgi:hypothetical protein
MFFVRVITQPVGHIAADASTHAGTHICSNIRADSSVRIMPRDLLL